MTVSDLKKEFVGAAFVDFTGTVDGANSMKQFGPDFVKLVRDGGSKAKAVVIVDRGFGWAGSEPVIVSDHLNLTGDNPLVGPNNPLGPRFPIVQGIYLNEKVDGCTSGIVAGLKQGTLPSAEDQKVLNDLNVKICSYNLVPSMLIAAHAGWKVFGIVLPEKTSLQAEQVSKIKQLIEGK